MSWLLLLAYVSLVDLSHEESVKQTPVTNLSCEIYNVTAMNCTWNASTNPPEEYRLFLNFEKKEEECPSYIKNEHGKRVCHIAYVSADKEEVTATLKKSINQSLIVLDSETFELNDIEILLPPQNITVNCNEALCNVEWTHPPNRSNFTSNHCFKYTIKDEAGNEVDKIKDTNRDYPADKKQTLRIRAKGEFCLKSEYEGEWSAPIEIGSDPYTFPTISLILVVLGTVLIISVLFFLCKRFRIWQKLNDPIPQPNLILDPDENIGRTWVDFTQSTDEKITFIEEMINSSPKNEGLSSTSQPCSR